MTDWIKEWVDQKISIAQKLYKGECGASYPEAVIISCSIISGIASEIWKGDRIDRKRFVELLVRYCAAELNTKNISIPLFVWNLKKTGNVSRATAFKNTILEKDVTRVLTDNDIDLTEEEVIQICPEISLREIRKFSYANLLYQQLRSGYIHEYRTNDFVHSLPMTTRKANISYVNVMDQPYRSICFHFEWLIELIKSILNKVQPIWDTLPLEEPQKWWIEGNG